MNDQKKRVISTERILCDAETPGNSIGRYGWLSFCSMAQLPSNGVLVPSFVAGRRGVANRNLEHPLVPTKSFETSTDHDPRHGFDWALPTDSKESRSLRS
ncbi:hypothetical protein VTJ04DRAFT_9026 [Mycothermus thermophilus]|uniref:uncharacterized protein n=1 Tax=Humicola insolens TaxID=85995 RepID=UPI0037430A31